MPRTALPFADGFYVSKSKGLLDKRVVNLYPATLESEGSNNKALFSTPGVDLVSETAYGTSRGVIRFNDGVVYRVLGNTLVSIDKNNTITSRGTITGNSDVSMTTNGINIAIQDPNGDSYFFTPSSNLLESNNGSVFLSFGQARSVAYKDGYYIYNTDTSIFSSSAKTTNDGKDFNALDFADAEVLPDSIIKVHTSHNQLYVMGDESTEVFSTQATSGFPFIRTDGAFSEKGCTARNSVIDFYGDFMFIGRGKNEKPAIWKMQVSTPVKISTNSIDQLLHQYDESVIEDARAFTYAEDGNYFAVFTVGNNTFVYDAQSSILSGRHQWHERQTGITDGNGFQKWRCIHGVDHFGVTQVGDDRSGNIGELNRDTYKEYGDKIERFFSTRPFNNNGDQIFNKEIELSIQSGVGNSDIDDPQVRMDYSDDEGNNFGSEVARSMGKIGEYSERVKWSRLGSIPNTRILRFKMSDPADFNVYNLYANAEAVDSG